MRNFRRTEHFAPLVHGTGDMLSAGGLLSGPQMTPAPGAFQPPMGLLAPGGPTTGLLAPDAPPMGAPPQGGSFMDNVNAPLLMAGLQIMANSGPSLQPNNLFEGVADAVAAGSRQQRAQSEMAMRQAEQVRQARTQAERQAALTQMRETLPPDQQALFDIAPDAFIEQLVGQRFGTPDLETIYQGDQAIQGYFRDGEFVEVGSGPRWQPPRGGTGGGLLTPETSGLPPGYMWTEGPDGQPTAVPITGLPPEALGTYGTSDEPAALTTYNRLIELGYSPTQAESMAFGDRAMGPGDRYYIDAITGDNAAFLDDTTLADLQAMRDRLNADAGFIPPPSSRGSGSPGSGTQLDAAAVTRLQSGDMSGLTAGSVYVLPDGTRFRYEGNGEATPLQ